MKLYLAILLVIVAVAVASKEEEDLWKSYKKKFNKNHSSKEDVNRKRNFIKRQKVIEAHNRDNKEWEMGHNKFSDMTEEETNVLRGTKMVKRRVKSASEPIYPVNERALPTYIDYRSNRCLQPVEDQGECGSCWAFAAITALEFNHCKKTGARGPLSEQMLVDCDTYNFGCNGGDFTQAWQYLENYGGAVNGTSYPYVSGTTQTNGTCKSGSNAVAARVGYYNWVIPYPNATLIMSYLQMEGPLPSAIKVLDSFFYYTSGVYSDPACIVSDEYDVNHAVVIVGYGTVPSTTTSPAIPYWIVRNSWSTGWGNGGYFFIRRGVNMCNIESWTAFVRAA
ncbi:Crammer [Daphnia magna]|uniref:Crammer n=1 Tax=Daphnia magna TaxID=35525 RepID=A0A164UCK0_9CRUS|nr:Crammer [Daphnia magna]